MISWRSTHDRAHRHFRPGNTNIWIDEYCRVWIITPGLDLSTILIPLSPISRIQVVFWPFSTLDVILVTACNKNSVSQWCKNHEENKNTDWVSRTLPVQLCRSLCARTGHCRGSPAGSAPSSPPPPRSRCRCSPRPPRGPAGRFPSPLSGGSVLSTTAVLWRTKSHMGFMRLRNFSIFTNYLSPPLPSRTCSGPIQYQQIRQLDFRLTFAPAVLRLHADVDRVPDVDDDLVSVPGDKPGQHSVYPAPHRAPHRPVEAAVRGFQHFQPGRPGRVRCRGDRGESVCKPESTLHKPESHELSLIVYGVFSGCHLTLVLPAELFEVFLWRMRGWHAGVRVSHGFLQTLNCEYSL